MKKLLFFSLVMLLSVSESFSQASFNTGAVEVSVNEYGRIRLFTPDGLRHLQRASALVGSSSTTVFDYTNDAEAHDPTVLVENPTSSDFEIFGSYDNTYSMELPNVIVELNAYGWTDGNYTIVKFGVINNDAAAMVATFGLDIIPELNELYGFDSVTYDSELQIIRFHRGNQVNMGLRLLSAPLTSLYSFEWYDGYSVDSDYWSWMNSGSLQPQYASETADGPVTITGQEAVSLDPSQSFNVYYAFALGNDEAEMLANLEAAQGKYELLTVGINELANNLTLLKNQPNPFSNYTTISYQIIENGLVSLKVFDANGRVVSTLVNENQTAGNYEIGFDASELAEGIYYYTIESNNQVKTNKMVIVK